MVFDETSPLRPAVVRKVFRGAEFLYTLRAEDGTELLALFPSHRDCAVGQSVGVRLDLKHLSLFAA